jgi:hypothetical protein
MTEDSKLRRGTPYLVALLASAIMYALTFRITATAPPGTLGPAFWPRVAISLIAIVSAIEMLRIALGGAAALNSAAEEDGDDAPRQPWRLAGGIVLLFAYAAAITTLGYVLASFLLFVALIYIGGYRNHFVIWTTSLLGMAAIAFVFLKVVYVSLPRGVAPFDALTQSILGLIGI